MEDLQVGREMTYGEKAVGLTFNPSGDTKVQKIKELYAEIIDLVISEYTPETEVTKEKGRIVDFAIKEAQSAQMWAVKAITFKY